jgi:hypothetical protein
LAGSAGMLALSARRMTVVVGVSLYMVKALSST